MSEDLTDEQIDALVSGLDQPVNEVMPETAPAEQPAPASEFEDFKFTANGKEVVPDSKEKIQQWMSQGYNYAQHMQDLKAKTSEYEQREQEFKNRFNEYERINEYAAANPDWWNHVQNSYQGAQGQVEGTQQADDQGLANTPEFQQLQSKLNEIEGWRKQLLEEKELANQRAEDEALSKEIQSIREDFQDLDWNTKDAEGKDLEYKVLEHAQNIGTTSFRAAFRDFYHDQLLQRAEVKGKDAISKELQRNKALGLLGETPAPLKKLIKEENVKARSYDDLERDALAELGIAN